MNESKYSKFNFKHLSASNLTLTSTSTSTSSRSSTMSYKSILNEYCQKNGSIPLKYHTEQIGALQNTALFKSTIKFQDRVYQSNESSHTKKEAEELVASKVCAVLKLIPISEVLRQAEIAKLNYFSQISVEFYKLIDIINYLKSKKESRSDRLDVVLIDIENTANLFEDIYSKYSEKNVIIVIKSLTTPRNIIKDIKNALCYIGNSKEPETSKNSIAMIIGATFMIVDTFTIVTKASFSRSIKEIMDNQDITVELYP